MIQKQKVTIEDVELLETNPAWKCLKEALLELLERERALFEEPPPGNTVSDEERRAQIQAIKFVFKIIDWLRQPEPEEGNQVEQDIPKWMTDRYGIV